MRKVSLFLLLIPVLFIASCGGKAGDNNAKMEAKGGRVYGGALKLNFNERIQFLYPYTITDQLSEHIASQVFEGLVKFDPRNLEIKPNIAEKWEVDETGTVYKFFIKKGVFFQDDACFPEGKGREIKAQDVKYSFELLCNIIPDNYNFSSTFKDRIVGANKYYEASKKGKPAFDVEGIKVVNDNLLQITLESPNTSFLSILASPLTSIVAKEGVEKYGKNLKFGSGPFCIADNADKSDKLILVKNNNYHGTDSLGNRLPFLDSIVISFVSTKQGELEEFRKNNLDAVLGLPAESIRELVESQISNFQDHPARYVLDRTPEMSVQYYDFNATHPPFNNPKVRQAFNYAIDRNKIIDDVLKGEAFGPAMNGICPPIMKDYVSNTIVGYEHNIEKAKKLMAEAGFPGGKGFPRIKAILNSGGSRHANVIVEIQKQLKEALGVEIEFEIVSLAQRNEDAQYAKADLVRGGWVADFPSPENFLWLFYGKNVPETATEPSFPNTSRYRNEAFDKLFEEGRSTKEVEQAYAKFIEAEKLMVEDAPILFLWYDANYRLVQAKVKNLFANPIMHADYSQVYFKVEEPEVKDANANVKDGGGEAN